MKYRLVVHPELAQEIDRLRAAWEDDPTSEAGREFEAFDKAMSALEDGREDEYTGKQLSYGGASHDLRDAAELKVEVFENGGTPEWPRPSHRLVYREFDPVPMVGDDAESPDSNALPTSFRSTNADSRPRTARFRPRLCCVR
jgi:hypothetical protein